MKKMISILLLLFISVTCSVCETFEVRSGKSFYQVFKNEDITLKWNFTKSSLKSTIIFCYVDTDRKISTLLDYYKGREYSYDGPFEGRVQWDKDILKYGRISLNVSSLRTEDSGVYRCDVKGHGSASCNITVKDKLKTTPETKTETKTETKDGKTWTGECIGLSIGLLALVLLVCGFAYWCSRKGKFKPVNCCKKNAGVNSAERITYTAGHVEFV